MRPRPKMLGAETAMTIHDFSALLGTGEERRLTDYRGKVLLIVNVASKCGFTPQYNGLQSLYEQFQPRGFEILAFPCDQFGHQEPGSDAEIATFCDATYGVTFPLFAKIEVNGKNAHPLYAPRSGAYSNRATSRTRRSGFVIGAKRARTTPALSTRNFVKFHFMLLPSNPPFCCLSQTGTGLFG
jgi:glutathione peroxidase-family protein